MENTTDERPDETEYLLSSPANAAHLAKSREQAQRGEAQLKALVEAADNEKPAEQAGRKKAGRQAVQPNKKGAGWRPSQNVLADQSGFRLNRDSTTSAAFFTNSNPGQAIPESLAGSTATWAESNLTCPADGS